MKRICLGTGTLILALAALMWTTVPAHGGKGHGGGGGGHASGGGHAAPAHTGSVHYASPAPARAAPAAHVPAVQSGSVRTEHYAGGASGNRGGAGYGGGGYGGTRYSNEYFNRFRPGFLPYILSDGLQYYGYYDLPIGYQQVVVGGVTYDYFDGMYYQAYMIGGRTVYMVVPN